MFLQKPMLGTQLDHSDSLNNPVLDLLFNEGHGNIVNDLSGHGNNGTLHGFDFPPTRTSGWNPGQDGVALAFDGSDDYINCGNNPSLNLTKAMTIDTVIKVNSLVNNQCIVNKAIASASGYYFQILNSGALRYSTNQASANQHTDSAAGTITTGVWNRVIATRDGTIGRVYKNGVDVSLIQQSHLDPVVSAEPMSIGVCQSVAAFSTSLIARVRILPRAMSAFEVMQTQINPYAGYLQ